MWGVTRFGISHYLAFAWSFKRMRMRANAFSHVCCFYPFAWVSMAFERVYQMSNVWMPFKRINTSNLMTFEFCFLIWKYHENRSAMSSFIVYVIYLGGLFFAVQFNVFTSLLWFLFIVYYLFLVMQQITNTVSLLKFQ